MSFSFSPISSIASSASQGATNPKIRITMSAVVSDIVIRSKELSFSDFEQNVKTGSVYGYENFKPFLEGDYEYQKCLYKCVLTSGNVSSQTRIRTLKVTIDVPDVVDKGSVVTSGVDMVRVYFNRRFYSVPSVTATLISGTVLGTPNVDNVTTKYFDVELLSSADARLVGELNWQAIGY